MPKLRYDKFLQLLGTVDDIIISLRPLRQIFKKHGTVQKEGGRRGFSPFCKRNFPVVSYCNLKLHCPPLVSRCNNNVIVFIS